MPSIQRESGGLNWWRLDAMLVDERECDEASSCNYADEQSDVEL